MNRRYIACLALLTLIPISEGRAQEKDPTVAGLLSAALPGAGSFYAGETGHGGRHLIIAGLSGLVFASSIGQCEPVFGDSDTCAVAGVSAAAFVANWVWGILSGVEDARRHNQYLAHGGLRFAPELLALEVNGEPSAGLRLLEFRF